MEQLLQVLRIKGRATAETLATALEADVGVVIEQCERDGLVENTRRRLPRHRRWARAGGAGCMPPNASKRKR